MRHFFTAFLTFIFSIGAFYCFKALLPDRLFAEVRAGGDNIAVDSMMILAMSAALAAESLPDTAEVEAEAEESHPLGRFFNKLFALEKTRKGAVRVAYFGDSMIEHDKIAMDIRRSYQEKYGGSGRGFVVLSNKHKPVGPSRYEFSPQWATHTFLDKSPIPVGVSGYVSVPKPGASAWTRYQNRHKDSQPLARPTLFYGRAENDSATVTIIAADEPQIAENLPADELLNRLLLTESAATELTLRFNNAAGIPFYGVDFSDGDGVYIDNFPMLSSGGMPLATLDTELMNAFHQELRYDLVILQFGLNVINLKPLSMGYGWYAREMEGVVKHMRECFPGADILVISLPDRAKSYDGVMKSDRNLPALVKAQEQYAGNSGAAFINLFSLMGGAGSMLTWAKQGMALKDYTHFNFKGSTKAAGIIFKQMEDDYGAYKNENGLSLPYNIAGVSESTAK